MLCDRGTARSAVTRGNDAAGEARGFRAGGGRGADGGCFMVGVGRGFRVGRVLRGRYRANLHHGKKIVIVVEGPNDGG